MTRRDRRRASDVANLKSSKPWFTIMMIIIGLVIIFFMKSTVSDQTAGLFAELVGDPDLELPESVSDRSTADDLGFKIPVNRPADPGLGAIDAGSMPSMPSIKEKTVR
ncbi:MAG: hypothetical protein VX589_18485 [Myxococcota bacterium]|nr:hypothetical protein [Myxococcota bacterium]